MLRPSCPTARAHVGWHLLQHPGGREERGAWRRALGGSLLEGCKGRCSPPREWALRCSRTGKAQLHTTGTWGSPRPAWPWGLGAFPHQALCNPVCLMCLSRLAELPPSQELCTGEEGVPRGLQRSRGLEMAPQPREGDLAASPSSRPGSKLHVPSHHPPCPRLGNKLALHPF